MSGYTIFIADLHLNLAEPKVTVLFFKFIREIATKADEIYILGDFFKIWVGSDDSSLFEKQIENAIKTISNKIPVYLMPGNRDFLLNQEFAKKTGCILVSDPCKIDLYKTATLLTHGDILCTEDKKYLFFRLITRAPFGASVFLKLPLKFRIWLGNFIQKYAIKNKLTKNKSKLIPQIDTIKKLMKKFSSNQIIHGHTHEIEMEEFNMDGKKMKRFALGEWNEYGNILIYYQDGRYEFKKF